MYTRRELIEDESIVAHDLKRLGRAKDFTSLRQMLLDIEDDDHSFANIWVDFLEDIKSTKAKDDMMAGLKRLDKEQSFYCEVDGYLPGGIMFKMIDIFTPDGPIGAGRARLNRMKKGLGTPFAVTALIFSDKGRTLSVSRRNDLEDFNLPGGKIEPGETPYTAIIRELKEETGLDIKTGLKECFVKIDEDDHVCITYSYGKTISEDSVVVGLREGEAMVAWKTWEDITADNTYAQYNQSLKESLE